MFEEAGVGTGAKTETDGEGEYSCRRAERQAEMVIQVTESKQRHDAIL